MRGRYLGMVSLTALLVLALAGCTQIGKVIAPVAKINKITVEATVAAPGAPVSGKLAAGIPQNLPLWPGSIVLVSRITKADHAWTTKLSTKDPYKEVVAGVGVGFQKAGWKVEALDMSSNEMSSTVLTVSTSKVDGIVTIATAAKKTVQVGYVMTAK